MRTAAWTTLKDGALGVSLDYPPQTPGGCAVDLHRGENSRLLRAHLISRGSAEVYFEVRRYLDMDLAAGCEQLVREIEDRAELEIGRAEVSVLGNLAATSIDFSVEDRLRRAVLASHRADCLRLIYDPSAPLNRQILKTLAIL